MKVLALVAAGRGSGDERRVRELLADTVDLRMLYAPRGRYRALKLHSLIGSIRRSGADVVLLEGTGVVPGLAVLLQRSVPYVVSSGDAVSSYLRLQHGVVFGFLAHLYERVLYTGAAGFVGWTPYLTGRAVHLGARLAVTVEGVAPLPKSTNESRAAKDEDPERPLTVGILGSLNWNKRQAYSYGLELANAASSVLREDVRFVVIGDGSGRKHLERAFAGDERAVFLGRVPPSDVKPLLLGLDVAVIAQTPEPLGMLRLTTKLPELLEAGVAIAMTASPAAVDYLLELGVNGFFPLPLLHPADPSFARELAGVIDGIDMSAVRAGREDRVALATRRFGLESARARLIWALRAATRKSRTAVGVTGIERRTK